MIYAPALLSAVHDLSAFSCGSEVLDNWLRKRALANQTTGASRTYVVAESHKVIGYYALASGGVSASEAPGSIRRNMPDPVPVMILARLAIDSHWQGKGVGGDLLRDAVLRTLQAAEIGGIRALLVHALDESAARFYGRFGFKPSPIRPLTYFLPIPGIKS
jgi:GNAT superfamily N-acetyltransferase